MPLKRGKSKKVVSIEGGLEALALLEMYYTEEEWDKKCIWAEIARDSDIAAQEG